MPFLPHLLHAPRWRPAWRALLAALVLVICWLAFTPEPPQLGSFSQVDKLEHLAAFFALATVACLGWPAAPGLPWRVAAALLAFGVGIEAVQSQLPTRTAEVADVVADMAGVLLGLLVLGVLRRHWPLPKCTPAQAAGR